MMKSHENKMLPREAVSNKTRSETLREMREARADQDRKRKAKRKMKKLI